MNRRSGLNSDRGGSEWRSLVTDGGVDIESNVVDHERNCAACGVSPRADGSRLCEDCRDALVRCDGGETQHSDVESAYRSVTKARGWANGLAEERIPRLENPDEWDAEDLEALDSLLEDVRQSVQEISTELLSAEVALDDVLAEEVDDGE